MKVLFDQNVPANIIAFLLSHQVRTSAEMGWDRLVNGELLRAAEAGEFEVFVTADQSLSYQQNLAGRKIAIVVLTRNNWPKVKRHIQEIIAVVDGCSAGDFVVVECGP